MRVSLAGPEASGGQGAAQGLEILGMTGLEPGQGSGVKGESSTRGSEFHSVVADAPPVTAERPLWPGRTCPCPALALEVSLQKPSILTGSEGRPARPGCRATRAHLGGG